MLYLYLYLYLYLCSRLNIRPLSKFLTQKIMLFMKTFFKTAALSLVIFATAFVFSDNKTNEAVAQKPFEEIPSGGKKLYQLWCNTSYNYGACSDTGNGYSCATEKSCPKK